MSRRPDIAGIDSSTVSIVRYPSCVFALEKAGVYAYERFAYDALRIGIEALNTAGLSDSLEINFEDGLRENRPWILNAGVSAIDDGGHPSGFRIATSPFAPLVLLGLCMQIGPVLSNDQELQQRLAEPDRFLGEVKAVAGALGEAVAEFRQSGLGPSLRRLLDEFGVDLWSIRRGSDHYDSAVQFIVNHEVAHAYVGQFLRLPELDEGDFRAFEIIVDLVGVSWLYSRFIRNTPDTEAYRRHRHFGSHAESIRANASCVVRSQLIVLAFLALAGAVNNGGEVSLEGGSLHPHTLIRYILQDVHFGTLVLSNYGECFDCAQAEEFHQASSRIMELFLATGLVTQADARVLMDDGYFTDVRRAAEIAQALGISELRGATALLAELSAFRPDAANPLEKLSFATERHGKL